MKVNTPNTLSFFTALVGAMIYVPEIEASLKFVAMLPNGGNVPDTPAIGHPDGTGESAATNDFGDAFADAGHKWTKELCEADTDGDGQTNGQEVGDPCCEWDMDTNPVVQWTDGVSHPDDATKTSDESLWANIVCGSASASAKTTEAVEGSSSAGNSTASSSAGSKTSSTPTSTSAPTSSSQSSSAPSTSSASVPTQSIIVAAAGIVTVAVMALV